MRLKLKQSNFNSKRLLLPPIKIYQPSRYTPRNKSNNRSLPKIIPSYNENEESNAIYHYRHPHEKKPLKEKIKSIYNKKKNHQLLTSIEQEPQYNELDDANLTSNFKKEIQKNLIMIKREKENQKKKTDSIDKIRYNSPKAGNTSCDSIAQNDKKLTREPRSVTQENVFSKINQIIIKSQSKSTNLVDFQKQIPQNLYAKLPKSNQTASFRKVLRQKLKTQGQIGQFDNYLSHSKKKIQLGFKNTKNYHQWRKLSIDSQNNSKVSYDMSSYQLQTDRLQKITHKNDLSLKKYFEGKSYLNRLFNYRDSSVLLSKKE